MRVTLRRHEQAGHNAVQRPHMPAGAWGRTWLLVNDEHQDALRQRRRGACLQGGRAGRQAGRGRCIRHNAAAQVGRWPPAQQLSLPHGGCERPCIAAACIRTPASSTRSPPPAHLHHLAPDRHLLRHGHGHRLRHRHRLRHGHRLLCGHWHRHRLLHFGGIRRLLWLRHLLLGSIRLLLHRLLRGRRWLDRLRGSRGSLRRLCGDGSCRGREGRRQWVREPATACSPPAWATDACTAAVLAQLPSCRRRLSAPDAGQLPSGRAAAAPLSSTAGPCGSLPERVRVGWGSPQRGRQMVPPLPAAAGPRAARGRSISSVAAARAGLTCRQAAKAAQGRRRKQQRPAASPSSHDC